MAGLYEGELKEALSLYDWDISQSPAVRRTIGRINHHLDGQGDYGPLNGLASGSATANFALSHFPTLPIGF